jgi:hypothetical protein
MRGGEREGESVLRAARSFVRTWPYQIDAWEQALSQSIS